MPLRIQQISTHRPHLSTAWNFEIDAHICTFHDMSLIRSHRPLLTVIHDDIERNFFLSVLCMLISAGAREHADSAGASPDRRKRAMVPEIKTRRHLKTFQTFSKMSGVAPSDSKKKQKA